MAGIGHYVWISSSPTRSASSNGYAQAWEPRLGFHTDIRTDGGDEGGQAEAEQRRLVRLKVATRTECKERSQQPLIDIEAWRAYLCSASGNGTPTPSSRYIATGDQLPQRFVTMVGACGNTSASVNLQAPLTRWTLLTKGCSYFQSNYYGPKLRLNHAQEQLQR